MEDNIVVVIDFFGLPGCGKSTVSHIIAEELRAKGKRVAEPTYELDNLKGRFLRKVIKVVLAFTWGLLHLRDLRRVCSVVKENGYHGGEYIKEIINIVLKFYFLQKYDSYDYLIFDEGLFQAAISLSLESEIDANNNLKLLSEITRIKNKYISVHLAVSQETALQRMNGRETNDSRVEQEKDEDIKKAMLSKYELNCEKLLENSDFSVCGDELEASSIAEFIMVKMNIESFDEA